MKLCASADFAKSVCGSILVRPLLWHTKMLAKVMPYCWNEGCQVCWTQVWHWTGILAWLRVAPNASLQPVAIRMRNHLILSCGHHASPQKGFVHRGATADTTRCIFLLINSFILVFSYSVQHCPAHRFLWGAPVPYQHCCGRTCALGVQPGVRLQLAWHDLTCHLAAHKLGTAPWEEVGTWVNMVWLACAALMAGFEGRVLCCCFFSFFLKIIFILLWTTHLKMP